jgi:predicted ATPase
LRFTHVWAENWHNFSRLDAALALRVFLVGPNACGKSNFLRLFRFLQDIVSVGGGFQAAVRNRGGVSKLRCLVARSNSDVEVKVALGEGQQQPVWEYGIRFNQHPHGPPVLKEELVLRNGRQILARPDEKDRSDPERLTQTYLEQVQANHDFRPVADFFNSVRYLHIVPQLIQDPDRAPARQNDPYGGDFLEQVARTSTRTQKARLGRIAQALCVAVPQLGALELWRDVRGVPHLRGRYEHWRPQGAWQTEEQFSDGTLRLMGLLWAALEGQGPLLLEEPELSLHPDVVRYLPQMFARLVRRTGRQVLISTHSPELLADLGIGLDEVLVLRPDKEGTTVESASSRRELRALLDGGLTLGDAVLPQTTPRNVQQLPLFGE